MFKNFFENPNYKLLENENKFTKENVFDVFNMINKKISRNPDIGEKFARSATQIVESGTYNGCAEYATVFENFSRALGIPTVHVLTANHKWIKAFKNGERIVHSGHHFCECYLSGKWYLIDPIHNKIYDTYNKEDFNITTNRGSKYYVYAKCNEIFELDSLLNASFPNVKDMVGKHNNLMDALFKDFDMEKLKESEELVK